MPKREKPLPTPPRKGQHPGEAESPLLADQLAGAVAQGRLDEFIKTEIPDSEYSGKLVNLMMGMTGMAAMVPQTQTAPAERGNEEIEPPVPPDDLLSAVQGGDPKVVMGILAREHAKRSPDLAAAARAPEKSAQLPEAEKEILDALMKVASENSVTMDWLIMRALKLYLGDYRKTGRL